jgi:hypothetical protein
VPVLQLSYDDKVRRFPWERGYARPELQPRPGTFGLDLAGVESFADSLTGILNLSAPTIMEGS